MKLLFFVIVLLPFCVFEGIRFHTLLKTCQKVHWQNELLLSGTDCNAWERHHFEKKDKMCREAEEEHKISPFWCACHHLWSQGEPLRVWKMFTESHWMLLGITVPVVCFIIYMYFSSWNHDKMLRMQENMYKETLKTVKNISPHLPPHSPAPVLDYVSQSIDLVPRAGRRRQLVAPN